MNALGSSDRNAAARAEAVLIRYYGERAVPALIVATTSENPGIRYSAAWTLGRTGDARALEPLITLTHDPDPGVRYDATVALGTLGNERAVQPLIELMCVPDPESSINSAAALGLERLGKPAMHALLGLLSSPAQETRALTAYTLGGIGDTTAVEPLAGLLADEDEGIRIAGIEALAAIGTQSCLRHIEDCLNDESASVRGIAAYWCGQLRRDIERKARAKDGTGEHPRAESNENVP